MIVNLLSAVKREWLQLVGPDTDDLPPGVIVAVFVVLAVLVLASK